MGEQEQPEIQGGKVYEVIEQKVRNGFRSLVYFSSAEAAAKAIKNFWNFRDSSGQVKRGLNSGTLQPVKHTITNGDRTEPSTLLVGREKESHPGMVIKVSFNGNTEAINQQGLEVLRQLGYMQ